MKLSNVIKSTTAALILSTSLAAAQIPAAYADDPIVLQVAEQLAAQGFEITEVKITLLGRYKIEATAPGYNREIVIAGGSGTVLRDELNQTDSANSTSGTTDTGTGPIPDPNSVSDDDNDSDNGTGLDDGNDSNDDGSDDSASDDNGSDDNASDDNSSDDEGSDDNGSSEDESEDDSSESESGN